MVKHKIPRKLKKRIKNSVLILDLSKVPDNISIDEWIKFYLKTGIAIYKDNVIPRWISK